MKTTVTVIGLEGQKPLEHCPVWHLKTPKTYFQDVGRPNSKLGHSCLNPGGRGP